MEKKELYFANRSKLYVSIGEHDMREKAVGIKELAVDFGVKESTLRLWYRKGELPGYKLGRKIYIYPSAIERLKKPSVDVEALTRED